MKHRVMVWGHPQDVEIYQKSKGVWVAAGTYHGEMISTQDRSESSALKRWREAATYRGNL
jgi:hypothetical protein